MSRFFKREAALTVEQVPADRFFASQVTGLIIRDLRITFDIQKRLGKDPNSAKVSITNLKKESRSIFDARPIVVRVDAGYDGQLSRLFQGDLTFGTSKRERTEWTTELELHDGARAHKYARAIRSYRAGTEAWSLVAELASRMDLSPPKRSEWPELRRQFAGGVTLDGPAHREMSRVLAPYQIDWSIQDGQLQLLRSTDTRASTPIIVSQRTGMIGSPEFGPPPKKGKSPMLLVRSLLDARLVPGGTIRLQSRDVEGDFRIEQVTHRGDTHGTGSGSWSSEMEAKPL